MDPAINRLITSESASCRTPSGKFATPAAPLTLDDYVPCQPSDRAFHQLAAQYAFAIAPTAMHPARTTGVGGFHISMEAAYTGIDSDAEYWKLGSRGSDTLAGGNERNANPASILQLYSMKFRKGFGYGFEVAAQSGFMPQTSLWSTGADVRISLLEGFRKGIPGFVPDLAAGGGVRTMTGTSQFQLTVASFDLELSKPIRVAEAVVVTPWLGYQQLYAFIDAHVTDFTPRTDEETECDSLGNALPGQAQDAEDGYTGRTVCAPNRSGADFDNNRTFKNAVIERQRLIFGASLRHEILSFGAQFITDFSKPEDAQNNAMNAEELKGMPRQWTVALDAGLFF